MLRKLGDPWAQLLRGGWWRQVTHGGPDPVLLDACRARVGYWDTLTSSKTPSKPSPVLGVPTVSPWVQVSHGLLASPRNQGPGVMG